MTKINLTQSALLKMYTDSNRERFNEELFTRRNEDIISELQKTVLSCQRNNQFFILRVNRFTVIEDYNEIMNIMCAYEEQMNEGKKKKKVNSYDFVDLKGSDVILMIVNYYVQVKDKFETFDVYILVPRIVDKYYFRISGTMYSAMYQIVDGSTYNNATSSSNTKTPNTTFKTLFMPIKVYRNTVGITNVKGEEVILTRYNVSAFNKSFNGFRYILARFGLYNTFKFMGINCISLSDKDPEDDTLTTFKINNIYISVPTYVLENDNVTQSLIVNIYSAILKDTKLTDLYDNSFWVKSLGGEFSSYTVEKGISILASLEGIYDISTQESINLPYDDKKDIYSIIRWNLREFTHLRAKDNLDVSTKKIRFPEYLASLYAMKVCQAIYRISDSGSRTNIKDIRKYITTRPTYLLESITKCKLVSYRNLVNDLDSMIALKYTYKGISGIGEKDNNSVPAIYRTIHPSHLGRVDIDSSPKSDPGMSGMLCPFVKLNDKYFSEFEEPNFWEEEFSNLMNDYKKLKGLKEIMELKESVLGEKVDDEKIYINDSLETTKTLIQIIKYVEDTTEIVDTHPICIDMEV